MGVGYIVAIYLGFVIGHCVFSDGVLNLSAVFILIQIGETPLPVIICGDGLGIFLGIADHQIDGDGLGTLAVLIIVVIPDLGTGDRNTLGSILIGNRQSIVGSGIVTGVCFLNRIFDFLSVCVLSKALEGVFPTIVSSDLGSCNLSAVGQQFHSDGLGSDTVTVILIVPLLFDRQVNSLGGVGVGDCEAVCTVAAHCSSVITGNIDLFDSIYNLLTACKLIQVVPGVCPVVASIQHNSIALCCTVCFQLNGDRVGTEASQVVFVVPYLSDHNRGLFGSVGVGNKMAVNRYSVAFYCIFRNSVGNFLIAVVLVQIAEGIGPAVFYVKGCGTDFFTVSKQVNGDGCGTDTVLVVSVIPFLGNSYGSLFNLFVSIGNGQGCFTQSTACNILSGQRNRIRIGGSQEVLLITNGDALICTLFCYGVSTCSDGRITLGASAIECDGLRCRTILQQVDGIALSGGKTGNNLLHIQLDGCPLGDQLHMGNQTKILIFTN